MTNHLNILSTITTGLQNHHNLSITITYCPQPSQSVLNHHNLSSTNTICPQPSQPVPNHHNLSSTIIICPQPSQSVHNQHNLSTTITTCPQPSQPVHQTLSTNHLFQTNLNRADIDKNLDYIGTNRRST